MRIHHLKTHRCKYIRDIRLDITDHTQIILGSNMCGKSTLQRLLIPYPVKQNVFDATGYAQLRLTHNDSAYTITCGHEKYSFMRDKLELNKTGKIGVQQKLAITHFGLTNETVLLLLGRINYTELNAASRRDWAIRLSRIDYDYILTVQSKLKKRLTYVKNIIKHQTEQLAVLGELDDIETMYVEYDDLQTRSSFLTPIADYNRKNIVQLKQKHANITTDIHNIELAIQTYDIPHDAIAVHTTLTNQYSAILIEQQKYVKQIHDVEKAAATRVTATELNNIVGQRDALLIEQSTYRKWAYDLHYDDVKNTCIRVGDDLLSYYALSIDQPLSELRRTYDLYTLENTKILECTSKLDNAIDTINSLSAHKQICPKCDHTFIDAESRTQYEHALKLKKVLPEQITELHTREELTTLLEHIKAQQWYESVRSAQIYPWHMDNESGHHKIMNDIESHQLWVDLQTKIDQLNIQIGLVTSIDSAEAKKTQNHLEKIQTKLSQCNDAASQTRSKLVTYDRYLLDIKALHRYADDYVRLKAAYANIFTELLYHIRADNACVDLDHVRDRIRELDAILVSYEHKKNDINKIETSVSELTTEKEALVILCKSLSPQDGLIGHTLKAFQKYFVTLVNQYISHVWTETLTVHVPNKQMKYPVSCLTESDDINETSMGMREILNLAFKLSVQKIMYPEYPLFLDEVGVNLDTVHRYKLYVYIKNTLFCDYPNAFIISHYKDLYSIFDNDTEFVVIDRDNIDLSLLPSTPNTGLTLE